MRDNGFTLISVVLAIIIIGILFSAAIPNFNGAKDAARMSTTKEEMKNLKKAIIGDPELNSDGVFIFQGYEADVGQPPECLNDLITKPDGVDNWNKWKKRGWNGPYMNAESADVRYDAWGNLYSYDPNARTITSPGPDGALGGGNDIVMNF
ncbi:type II secretion system protein GspG [bacterium]|nr:type II secretion system protein GspG [bacterium]